MRGMHGWFFLSIILISTSLHAADLPTSCNACLDAQIQTVLQDLQKLESHYLHYRWAEIKIRELYYDRLWKARRDAMDPLSKKTREQGKKEEEWLLSALPKLEKESLVHSNGFAETLRTIQNSLLDWRKCCPEKAFFDCASLSFQEVDQAAEQIRTDFEHIFEHEREFRKPVLLTAGGREGLYPEDAVESPAKHTDYYWRFEAEREPNRFAEDQKMRDLFHKIEKTLTWNFEGKRCCLEC